jgi:Asp-tRNA(Asn)/Glu-tRNA(Gln) amidotransferase A subunit family amidase
MNFAAAGIGTDTANSIRSPSSACALVGFRPTVGLVSREGIIPCSIKQDTAGPLARTVADCAVLLDALRGYDLRDTVTASQIGQVPDSYLPYLDAGGLQGKRLGILRTNMGTDAEVTAAMERAFSCMEQPLRFVDVDIPELETDRVFGSAMYRSANGIRHGPLFFRDPGLPRVL